MKALVEVLQPTPQDFSTLRSPPDLPKEIVVVEAIQGALPCQAICGMRRTEAQCFFVPAASEHATYEAAAGPALQVVKCFPPAF